MLLQGLNRLGIAMPRQRIPPVFEVPSEEPFRFRADPHRPVPWVRGLLSASGGRLFNTWVHLGSEQIEVEADVLIGHYVEWALAEPAAAAGRGRSAVFRDMLSLQRPGLA